ncbi:MAG TPA: ATP-dependent Clp protease adaptor ClpS [Phycisphaerae bacterium]|nr:ATP-dependent Clp protease adaptor ClpS [Phycisphaerae bacterium]HNU46022.1 ATP-dependent Clp protease adaptor ClpS [Phycisphaerae bacterium]
MATTSPSVTTGTRTQPGARSEPAVKRPPLYHVILLDDDYHTYEYVIGMLRKLFGYSTEQSYRLADEVDNRGRVILTTTTREHAELKRDQIHAFGRDWRIARCEGSMSATIEPAE